MPEASVDKDSDPSTNKSDVGGAGQVLSMDAEAKTCDVQC